MGRDHCVLSCAVNCFEKSMINKNPTIFKFIFVKIKEWTGKKIKVQDEIVNYNTSLTFNQDYKGISY
jgi:hypothetical protein